MPDQAYVINYLYSWIEKGINIRSLEYVDES